jgi:hypothetical protein
MESSTTTNIILCERDYYKYNDFKCHQCNQCITKDNYEIIGIYKYHRHCLHCPGCIISKNNAIEEEKEIQDTYERFDYNNRPYCRYHYSLIKGTECTGCKQTVLCQYTTPTNQQGKWHPECYMIMKVKCI